MGTATEEGATAEVATAAVVADPNSGSAAVAIPLPASTVELFTVHSCPAGSEPWMPLPFKMTAPRLLAGLPACNLCEIGYFSLANQTCQPCPEGTTTFQKGSKVCHGSPPPSPPPVLPPSMPPPAPPFEVLVSVDGGDATTSCILTANEAKEITFSGADNVNPGDFIVWVTVDEVEETGDCARAMDAPINDEYQYGGMLND